MKKIVFYLFLGIIGILTSCSVETEVNLVQSPVLELKAVGPMFEGSNTATATWEYNLKELLPDIEGEIEVESARILSLSIIPKQGVEYPNIGEIVMEMKPKEESMMRVGLLGSNFEVGKDNNLDVAEIQDDIDSAIKGGRLTFVADFELIDEEYYDDLTFDLKVSFEIQTRK